MLRPLTTAAAALLLATAAHAGTTTAALWNFNSTTPDNNTATGSLAAAAGHGTASAVGGTTYTFASGSGSSDPASSDDSGWNLSTFSTQGSGNETRGAQFMVSTVGLDDVVVHYDLRHSNTSSQYETLQYTVDGTHFVDAATFAGNQGDTWFDNRSFDFSSFAGVADNAEFGFRIVASFAPSTGSYLASGASTGSAYGTTGTWRFDMVEVTGQALPVPEPETLALVLAGLGLLGATARRRAR